jgi:hypothetical protein
MFSSLGSKPSYPHTKLLPIRRLGDAVVEPGRAETAPTFASGLVRPHRLHHHVATIATILSVAVS